ncbi:MAG: IS21 family transposase, partial [Peptococcaceae bacterium]|nr:IS21 family transposase [Peptococcaceae bacterium]
GNVENKVGYQRRNFMVPVPRFLSLPDYNRQLLMLCEEDADREHYRHNETIEERFQVDIKNCHPLPTVQFDLTGRMPIMTNKWGKFYLNKGMHEYSVSPKHAECKVNLILTSAQIIVQDENDHEIVRHSRLYGDTKQQQMDWLPYLKQLSLRPRALKYTGIYDLMPSAMKAYLEGCSPTEVGRVLKTLAELTNRTGFESAVNTVNLALSYDAKDADSLENLYRRLYANVPELPPMPLHPGIPKMKQMSAHLIAYDAFLERKGGKAHV